MNQDRDRQVDWLAECVAPCTIRGLFSRFPGLEALVFAPMVRVSQKILMSIHPWDANSRYPEGHFVRALGQAECGEAEPESLLLECEVAYRPFGTAILAHRRKVASGLCCRRTRRFLNSATMRGASTCAASTYQVRASNG